MISIIIPVYNEEESIAQILNYLDEQIRGQEAEVLIIDGGSEDDTIEIAGEYDVSIHQSKKKGRAAQMNYGASLAAGDVLYFLHADTYPPGSFINDIQKALEAGYVAGCYRLKFDVSHPALDLFSWFTKFDLNIFRFGDQSLFIKREIFDHVNGFNENLVVMEDQDIVRRIRRSNDFIILDGTVTTSARKYEYTGILKLQLIFSLILILYYMGVSQKVLVDFYHTAIQSSLLREC